VFLLILQKLSGPAFSIRFEYCHTVGLVRSYKSTH
jgi:hypothetical protein